MSAPRRVPTRQRPRRPAWQRLLLVAAALVALLLIADGIAAATNSGKARPGTYLGTIDLGGKSESQVRTAVLQATDGAREFTLSGAGQTLRTTAAAAGLRPDTDATVQRVMRSGRDGLLSPLTALGGRRTVDVAGTVDADALRSEVARLAAQVDRPAYAGGLQINAITLEAEVLPSRGGRTVRQATLREQLRDRLLRPGSSRITLPLTQGQPVPDATLRRIARQAEQYLRQPLTLRGAGAPYPLRPTVLAGVLAVESTPSGDGARLGVKASKVRALAARVATARDRRPRGAELTAPARGPIVDGKGEVKWQPRSVKVRVVDDGARGITVDQPGLAKAIRGAVVAGEHSVRVPAKRTTPPVSRRTAAQISHLIGTFTTYYEPGQPRVTNIQRIARSIDRTYIPAGAQFSLNELAGERTKAKGYVEAPFIAGNKIEPSVGGGVSQFSTTMYNAAYFAGLRLDASQPHSLYIARYPAGRDTTLNWPTIDLRWTNDTSVPVYIRTFTDATSVTVSLYGDNGGRRVRAVPGEREPNPGGDFRITVTRFIRYPDGRLAKEPRTTSYANEVKAKDDQE